MSGAERKHGDTWIGDDGRVYVVVLVRANEVRRDERIVSMLVATGADTTWLPLGILAEFGVDLEIAVRAKSGRVDWFRPTLGPLNPLHVNSQGGGVLGMDVLSKLTATVGFMKGLVVS